MIFTCIGKLYNKCNRYCPILRKTYNLSLMIDQLTVRSCGRLVVLSSIPLLKMTDALTYHQSSPKCGFYPRSKELATRKTED